MSDLNFASKVFRNDTDSAIWVRVGEFSVNEVGAYFDLRVSLAVNPPQSATQRKMMFMFLSRTARTRPKLLHGMGRLMNQ